MVMLLTARLTRRRTVQRSLWIGGRYLVGNHDSEDRGKVRPQTMTNMKGVDTELLEDTLSFPEMCNEAHEALSRLCDGMKAGDLIPIDAVLVSRYVSFLEGFFWANMGIDPRTFHEGKL